MVIPISPKAGLGLFVVSIVAKLVVALSMIWPAKIVERFRVVAPPMVRLAYAVLLLLLIRPLAAPPREAIASAAH
jgi:hypothetical protein